MGTAKMVSRLILLLHLQILCVASLQTEPRVSAATKRQPFVSSSSYNLRIGRSRQKEPTSHTFARSILNAAKGFGSSASDKSSQKGKKNKKRLVNNEENKTSKPSAKPFVKSEQEQMIAQLAAQAANTCIGKVVARALASDTEIDPFWELIPSLIASRFPHVTDSELERVAGFVHHTLHPSLPLPDDDRNDFARHHPYRPAQDLHAFMPNLGPTQPFWDPQQLPLCQLLRDNYDIIRMEYEALMADMKQGGPDRFQSVTSMNYEAGWKTLVLFYNSHRIPNFPYHLCPTTTKILETVPLAGRIAGFNRQQPQSGIPLHTDGNNMWLTCQMGIQVPGDGTFASIRVGPETRYWKVGECLVYDTTFEHETMNTHDTEERIVLHVDFFNTLRMTPVEIQVMQYIYSLREQFMKAEGVGKVGQQIL